MENKLIDLFSGFVRVENNRNVLTYICSDINRSIVLTTHLKDELNKIYGKYNHKYKGEFLFYCWFVEFEDTSFLIRTANKRGTDIYVKSPNLEFDEVKVINFLKHLEKTIINVKNT